MRVEHVIESFRKADNEWGNNGDFRRLRVAESEMLLSCNVLTVNLIFIRIDKALVFCMAVVIK